MPRIEVGRGAWNGIAVGNASWKMVTEFSRRQGRSAVGLTIGRRFVSMVRIAESRSGTTVEKAVTRPIPEPGGETEVVNVLRELITENRIRSHELNVAVPRNEITTRIITLPSTDEAEIHQMVQLEVEEFVPYSADELEVDEAILERLPDGSSKVLVAIAHRDVVGKPVALLTKAGAEPARIGVSCFALYNTFVFGAKSAPTGPVALLDVSDLGTDILVTDGGQVSFTRGLAHLSAPTATPEEIAVELKNSLTAYARETGGGTVRRVLLSGSLKNLDEVARTLSDAVGLDVNEADSVAQACSMEGTCTARYAIQAGLALSALQEPALYLNLIPHHIRERKEREEKRRARLVTAVPGALVLAIAVAIVQSNLADKRNYIGFLREQITRMEEPARLVKERKARVDAISSQLSRENSALEVLEKIHELAPDGLVLEDINFNWGEVVVIRGLCYDRPVAFAFAERLRDSGVEALARAEVGETQKDTQEKVSVIRYEIRAPMIGTEVGAQPSESSPGVGIE